MCVGWRQQSVGCSAAARSTNGQPRCTACQSKPCRPAESRSSARSSGAQERWPGAHPSRLLPLLRRLRPSNRARIGLFGRLAGAEAALLQRRKPRQAERARPPPERAQDGCGLPGASGGPLGRHHYSDFYIAFLALCHHVHPSDILPAFPAYSPQTPHLKQGNSSTGARDTGRGVTNAQS